MLYVCLAFANCSKYAALRQPATVLAEFPYSWQIAPWSKYLHFHTATRDSECGLEYWVGVYIH